MRLREFRVKSFRCIHDSGPIAVGDIAALLGKNESGKTALLEALTCLNKNGKIAELDICDEMHETLSEGSTIVEGVFELGAQESTELRDLVPKAPLIRTVRISRQYKTERIIYEFPDAAFPVVFEAVPEKLPGYSQYLKELIAQVDIAATVIDEKGKASAVPNLEKLRPILDSLQIDDDPDKAKVESAWLKFNTELRGVHPNREFSKAVDQLKAALTAIFRPVDLRAKVANFIFDNFHPKFVYFSEYRQILGTIHIPTFIGVAEAAVPAADTSLPFDKKIAMSNLFALAGLDPTHLETIKKNPPLRSRYLRECSQRLTGALAKTWKTQRIEIDLDYGIGDVLVVRVCDIHEDGSRTNFGHLSRRSQGFRWHFSFYVNFIAETRQESLQEAILLLDEPGVHLHPAQQAGMLDVLRELAGSNQILYTTHSPFMIYDYNVGAVLTIELDHVTHLSKVSPIIWKGDPETIFPILQVLGAPLLPGIWEPSLAPLSPPVVVVEGHTDLMYLLVLEQIAAQRSGERFFPRLWLQPAGGAPRVAALALFYFDRGFRTFALYDKEPDAASHAKSLKDQGFPEDRILFCECDSRSEADVEDLFTQEDYLRAVNELYRRVLKDAKFSIVTANDVEAVRKSDPSRSRIVPALEKIWDNHKDSGWGSFDKTKVCASVLQIAKGDEKYPTEKTLSRFVSLFRNVYSRIGESKLVSSSPAASKKQRDAKS